MSNKIINHLLKISNHTFAHIDTKTNPCKTTKKVQQMIVDMGHESITKIGSRNVSFGNNYNNAVGNRLEKNGLDRETFIAQPRPWAERINECLIQHKENGQVYVEYYYLSNAPTTSKYIWEDGTELTEEELSYAKENLFKKHYASVKQAEVGLTEEQQVKVNIVKIENVISVSAMGEKIIA